MDPLVQDDLVDGIVREGQTSLLELDAGELAIQLMREDYRLFKDIEQTEYIDDLFDLESKAGCAHLNQFSQVLTVAYLELPFVALNCVALCCADLHCLILCCFTLCCFTLCCLTLCCLTLCCLTLCCLTLCCLALCCLISP